MKASKKPKKPVKSIDPLEALAADPRQVIGLLLWKGRFQNQGLTTLITDKDIQGLQDCTTYLKVEADVVIERDKGRPASKSMSEVPPRPFVSVSLVEKGTKNALRPVENNEKDFEYSENLRTAKHDATRVSAQLLADLNTNTVSTGTIQEAAALLNRLAGLVNSR